jgi:hypothetical protein
MEETSSYLYICMPTRFGPETGPSSGLQKEIK